MFGSSLVIMEKYSERIINELQERCVSVWNDNTMVGSLFITLVRPWKRPRHRRQIRATPSKPASLLAFIHSNSCFSPSLRVRNAQLEFIKGYSDYVNVYEQARETISKLRATNSKFAAFLEEREIKDGVLTPLENYLIMPVQRVPRYEMLLTTLLKNTWKSHPDYPSLVEASKRAMAISERVNERKRLRENHDKMLQVYNSLTFGKKEKVDKSFLMNKTTRTFVQEGELTEQTIKGTPTRFQLFMFNDLLVWTKAAGRTFSFKAVDELATAQVKVHGNSIHMKCEPEEDTHIPPYMRIFRADSDADTQAWAKRLESYIDICRSDRQKQQDRIRSDRDYKDAPVTIIYNTGSRSPRPASAMQPSTTAGTLMTSASAHERAKASKAARDERRKPRGVRSTHLKLTELRFLDEVERAKNERVSEQVAAIKGWQTINDRAELARFEITSLSPLINQDAPVSARGPKKATTAVATHDGGDDAAITQAMFQMHGAETCRSFHDMMQSLATLSLHSDTPEIVFLGLQGSGKTSLVSAVIGYQLPLEDLKRPLFIHLIQNPAHTAESPLIWIRKDYSQRPRITRDVKISSPEQLGRELTKRAAKEYSEAPIHMFYEAAHVLNATLIDTPGLDAFQFHDDPGVSPAAKASALPPVSARGTPNIPLPPPTVRGLVYEVARHPHRHLVFVEECKHKGLMASASGLATVVDPNLTRSTFACTKFFHELRDMHSTSALHTYLHHMPAGSYFVTLPSEKALAQVSQSRVECQRLLLQAYARDLEILDILQYDTRFSARIGVHNFTRSVFAWVHRQHVQHIPHSLERLHVISENCAKQLLALEPRKEWTETRKLRQVANAFTHDVVKALPGILFGSTQVEAKVHGHTLGEERYKLEEDNGNWVDFYNQPIVADMDAFHERIPYQDAKLYGSAQIIRLFSVFNAIVQELQLRKIDREDIVAVVGQSYIMNTRDYYLQAALEIAHHKAEATLLPLVRQLCKRAGEMVTRLGAIAVRIVADGSSSTIAHQQGQYKREMDIPLFAGHVRVQYEHYGEELAERCLNACAGLLDQVLIDDVSKYATFTVPADANSNRGAMEKVVTELVARMFQDISKLFVRNITAQCYELLVAKGVEDISRRLQADIAGLTDIELSNLFDKDSFRIALQKEQTDLKAFEAMSQNSKTVFSKAIAVFSDTQPQRHWSSKVSYRKLAYDAELEAQFAAAEVALAAAAAKSRESSSEAPTPRGHSASVNTGRKSVNFSLPSELKGAEKSKHQRKRSRETDEPAAVPKDAAKESTKEAKESSKSDKSERKELRESKDKSGETSSKPFERKEKPERPDKPPKPSSAGLGALPESGKPADAPSENGGSEKHEKTSRKAERKASQEPKVVAVVATPSVPVAEEQLPAKPETAVHAEKPAAADGEAAKSKTTVERKPSAEPKLPKAPTTTAPIAPSAAHREAAAAPAPVAAAPAKNGTSSTTTSTASPAEPSPTPVAAAAQAPSPSPSTNKPHQAPASPTVPPKLATGSVKGTPPPPVSMTSNTVAQTPRDAHAVVEPLVRPSIATRTLSSVATSSAPVTSAGTVNAKEVIPANNAATKIAAFEKPV